MSRVRKHQDAAARVRAYRKQNVLVTLTVDLPADLVAGLNEYLRFKDLSKRAVIEKLIRSQLLRKR